MCSASSLPRGLRPKFIACSSTLMSADGHPLPQHGRVHSRTCRRSIKSQLKVLARLGRSATVSDNKLLKLISYPSPKQLKVRSALAAHLHSRTGRSSTSIEEGCSALQVTRPCCTATSHTMLATILLTTGRHPSTNNLRSPCHWAARRCPQS